MNKAYLLVICLLLTTFTGCLDSEEKAEENLLDEVNCEIISGEYEVQNIDDGVIVGYIKFSDLEYDDIDERCNGSYNFVDTELGYIHANSDGTVHDYKVAVSFSSSDIIITDGAGSTIIIDDSEDPAIGTLQDSGNITWAFGSKFVPCSGCFDEAKKSLSEYLFVGDEKGPEDLAEQCLGLEHTNVTFHFHSGLMLTVRGEEILIPNNMGLGTSACPEGMHLLHTHTSYSESQPGAKLHIEGYESKTIPLSLFFEVWNISESDDPSFQPLFQDMDNVTITIDGVKQTLGMDEIIFEDGILIEIVFDDGTNTTEVVVIGDTWGQLTSDLPEIYATSDVPQSQIDLVMDGYTTASEAWGNFGPLEFWIVGSEKEAAYDLDKQYCEVRMEKDSSLGGDYEGHCLNRSHNLTSYVDDGGAGLNMRRSNYEDYSVFIVTFASKYPSPDETDYTVVSYHEYFHVYQQAHIFTKDNDERDELMGGNPYWAEGGAEYMAQLLYSRQEGVDSNYLKDRMSWKMETKDDLEDGESIADISYGSRGHIAYDLGCWFTAYIINQTSEEAYVNGFYDDLNELGWEGSFVENFGVSSEQMLSNFDDFLGLSIEEQLEILP